MGLFDGQPLTRAELMVVTVPSGGATVRRVSHSGKIYTVRHRPWRELLGPGPAGKTCGDCQFLRQRGGGSKIYFKCGRQVITAGAGTDIRKRDGACRLFQAANHVDAPR